MLQYYIPQMSQIAHMQQPGTWDEFSASYERFAEPITSRFGSALATRLGIGAGTRVLDVAAGSGALALEMARKGARVTAIDHSQAMIARIAERAAADEAGGAVEALAMDGQALSFADGGFDVALSAFGVMMFPDHRAGLREMIRVTRPGGGIGLAIWREAGGAGPALLMRKAMLDLFPDRPLAPMPQGHEEWRHPDRLAASLAAAGLIDISIEPMSVDWTFPSASWLADQAPHLFAIMPIWSAADVATRAMLIDHMRRQLGDTDHPAMPSPATLATGTKPA